MQKPDLVSTHINVNCWILHFRLHTSWEPAFTATAKLCTGIDFQVDWSHL